MTIITRRPITSSLRGQQFLSHKDLTKKKPEKKLIAPLKKTGGRNAYGRITTRHIGGGAKRKYRVIDFRWSTRDVLGKIVAFEYDPNRNVSIALVVYRNGAKRYMLRPEELNVGDFVLASVKAEAKVGNSLPLRNIPVGFFIHNVEIAPGRGATLARSAGGAIQLLGKEGKLAILKMPSGETRTVCIDSWATVGRLSNAEYKNVTLGKAGRSRHRGIRPTVRGMAMNPVDHPHGGGEGRSKSGSHPVTPWGKGCKGTRTRKRKSSAILKRRK